MLLDGLLFAAGVALLVGGATALVSGGTRLAGALGVPPVLIGLTVVAWGTSVPELIVSLLAALSGRGDMMLGNVMGSNVANIGLILGAAAVLMAPPNDRSMWKLEIPLLILGTALFWVLSLDGTLGRRDGLGLMALFGYVTVRSIGGGLRDARARRAAAPADTPPAGLASGALLTALGMAGLVLGGRWIVDSSVRIAESLGAPEVVIGLTLVAVGTSLPELATTLVAAYRRESGIALGNVVGSNLFNLLAVAGPVAIIHPVPVGRELMAREFPSLGLMTLALVLVTLTRGAIGRVAGAGLLILYAALLAWWIV
ncbi:MAG TPA: calcium/sodium antiporter [Candidatus Krumholzibacteria bacterium]|nr:calcium/sodium antiporter [Candidatus Krumholzibacteria bacterium]HRX49772.1 calcium/sodium antiporter [Candidatus Krumholzibacteria bacterium]